MTNIICKKSLRNCLYINDIVNLFCKTFTLPPRLEKWDSDSALDYITSHNVDGFCSYISIDERKNLNGFIFLVPLINFEIKNDLFKFGIPLDSLYVSIIAVNIDRQGCGIGSNLMRFAIKFAKMNKYNVLVGRTRSDTLSAIQLFKSMGFSEISTYNSEIGGVTSKHIIHMKKLKH